MHEMRSPWQFSPVGMLPCDRFTIRVRQKRQFFSKVLRGIRGDLHHEEIGIFEGAEVNSYAKP